MGTSAQVRDAIVSAVTGLATAGSGRPLTVVDVAEDLEQDRAVMVRPIRGPWMAPGRDRCTLQAAWVVSIAWAWTPGAYARALDDVEALQAALRGIGSAGTVGAALEIVARIEEPPAWAQGADGRTVVCAVVLTTDYRGS